MRNILALTTIIFALQNASAQSPSPEPANNEIYNSNGVEIKPEFPGGISAFYKYVGDHFKMPTAKDFRGGRLMIAFTIEKDGSIADTKVVKEIGYGTSEEAIRMMKASPLWKPAEQNGKKVRCIYMLPITLMGNPYTIQEVDTPPSYQGGFEKLKQLILDNYVTPKDKGLKSGNVLITFIIEENGTLSDLTIYRDLGFGTGKEAIRVLSATKNWIPAQKDGKNVRCEFGIPIPVKGN